MRKFLFIVLLFVCTGISAQDEKKQNEPNDVYCIVFRNLLSKAGVLLPFNDDINFLVNHNGKKISFSNDSELLTFMNERGWKYVERTKYHGLKAYIMNKKVYNNDEIKEGLNFKNDKNNKED